jgi:hypothetical protein
LWLVVSKLTRRARISRGVVVSCAGMQGFPVCETEDQLTLRRANGLSSEKPGMVTFIRLPSGNCIW